MKKKILFFGAALAALTTFTGCSSDEDDVLTVQKKGTPFSVVVTDETGTTRATLVDGTTLANFKLYGKNTSIEDADKQMWINGNVFKNGTNWAAYNDAGTTTVDLTWPVDGDGKSLTTPTQFWAVSDNSATGVTIGTTTETSRITENIIANNGSFVYKFYVDPNEHTLQYGRRTTDTRGESTVIDLDKQSDLLIASASQTEGVDGQLTLAFRHALASLAIKARFTSKENNETTGIDEGSKLKIYWIRIHGLKGGGTFMYNDTYNADTKRWATSPWSTTGGSDVVYEIVFNEPIEIEAQAHTTGDILKTTLIDHTQLMVIPQSFTPWAGHDDPATEANIPGSGAYVEMSLVGEGELTSIKRQAAFLPLKINNGNILTGVKHTITLNLNYIMVGYGDYILEPSQIQAD